MPVLGFVREVADADVSSVALALKDQPSRVTQGESAALHERNDDDPKPLPLTDPTDSRVASLGDGDVEGDRGERLSVLVGIGVLGVLLQKKG